MYNRSRGCLAFKNCCSPLDEFKGKNEVSTVSLPLLFAVTLSIITLNIYTRLAACNCISITFWSGDLPSPLMAIFIFIFIIIIFIFYFIFFFFLGGGEREICNFG